MINIMCLATRVKFEMKDMCFEFVMNVSRHGNNVKIKFNLEVNFQRLQSYCFVKKMTKHQDFV